MKAELHRLEALVLGRVNYGEADLVVHFLTRDFGKINGLAKNARKSRKRFGNVLNPPAVVELEFVPRRSSELVRLERGDLLRGFDGLTRDPRLLGMAGLALELADAFCQPHDPSPEIYDLLVWCLERLDQNQRPDEAAFLFKVRLLVLAGFGPNLEGCGHCGRKAGEHRGGLKIEEGGWVCSECGGGGFVVSPGTLKLMTMARNLPLDRLERLRVGSPMIQEADPFLMAYLRHTLGRELKSARFLEQLGSI